MSMKMVERSAAVGRVHWELISDKTGKVIKRGDGVIENYWMNLVPKFMRTWLTEHYPDLLGQHNSVLNHARNVLADSMIGTSVTYPGFIGIATGTGDVTASDTALDTPVDYDGANEAKAVDTKALRGQFTARFITQFTTAESNQNIRQLGLFDAANSGNLWAKVSVVINKADTQRLNIYWYFTFERRAGLAIKSGTSIGATGSIVSDTDSTLTFASPITILAIENNAAAEAFIKFNGAFTGSPPTNYDYKIPVDGRLELLNEEIEINTVHVYMTDAITMPSNEFTVRGW